MRFGIPLPLTPNLESSIIEIRDVTVAIGGSAVLIGQADAPQYGAYVDVIVTARDMTANHVAMYHTQGAVKNLPALLAYATGTLTATGQPSNTNTVTINGKVYTFQTTLTNVNGNVAIGTDAEASLANLKNAINLGTGAGTAYAASMTLNAYVTATSDATHVYLTSKVVGTTGNAYTTTETHANASWGGATLSGGVDSSALIGSTDQVAWEDDNTWALTVTVDGPTNKIQVKATGDASNATVWDGVIVVYPL